MLFVHGHSKSTTSPLSDLAADLNLGCQRNDSRADPRSDKLCKNLVDVERPVWICGGYGGKYDETFKR
jgi:hypothetical protein